MAISDKIATLRKKHKWSQQKLAKMIGTSGPIIGRYERGEMTPSVEVAKKLSIAFDVTMDYLVDNSGAVPEIQDKKLLEKIIAIEHLEPEERNIIIKVIDSLLRDAKAKKAYSG